MKQIRSDFKGSPKGVQALDLVRREILSGRLAPGARLRQVELARSLGVSQSPVREALRQLQREGLVQLLPYAGAVVAPISPEEILELSRIRILLECDLMARAMPFHTAGTLREARGWLEKFMVNPDVAERPYQYMEYLRALYRPAARPVQLEQVLGLFRRSLRTVALQPEILARVSKDVPMTAAILAHLEAGDLGAAQAALTLLYRHAGIHGAAILYEAQLAAVRRARPRAKVQPQS